MGPIYHKPAELEGVQFGRMRGGRNLASGLGSHTTFYKFRQMGGISIWVNGAVGILGPGGVGDTWVSGRGNYQSVALVG